MPCIRVCKFTKDYNGMEKARKWWEEWDLRILTLYIVIAQLYLHFYGRLRRTNKSRTSSLMMLVNVWLLYSFSDLLATIALGKLSKLKVNDSDNDEYALRVMWAPLVLFFLGGPDTLTVFRVEENQLWVRHLIGLLTQGLRTAYALIVTFNLDDLVLSLLAVLLFIPGIIKYGERVWVARSSKDYAGFVRVDVSEINKTQPEAKPVLLAYSWFWTLRPHNASYMPKEKEVRQLQTVRMDDAFKLVDIELGMIYDLLFSKVGTIFTVWGSILRFLSFSLIVSVLVTYITCEKHRGRSNGDHIITIILLAGAIFLDIAGIFVQLISEYGVVWACKSGSKWATSLVLFLHEFLNSKSQTWSRVTVGQFSLGEFCKKYKPNVCNRSKEYLFGREYMLGKFSSQKRLDLDHFKEIKDLIIRHLEISPERVADVRTSQTIEEVDKPQTSTGGTSQAIEEVDKPQTSTGGVANVKLSPGLKRGDCTLAHHDGFKWRIKGEFGESIVIWHIATEVCYKSDSPSEVKLKAVKILSDYMMYLLVLCPNMFPFCNEYEEITQHYDHMKEIFQGSRPEAVENENDTLMDKAKRLVQDMEGNLNRWEIMGSMWAEMLCYAAMKCPEKNHMQELPKGGEFLTHVWLLLLHFGKTKELDRSTFSPMGDLQQLGKPLDQLEKEFKQDENDQDISRVTCCW